MVKDNGNCLYIHMKGNSMALGCLFSIICAIRNTTPHFQKIGNSIRVHSVNIEHSFSTYVVKVDTL